MCIWTDRNMIIYIFVDTQIYTFSNINYECYILKSLKYNIS